MASNIILKKSSVVAKVPVAGDLQFGELALNYADGKLYYKKSDGTTIDAFQAGTGGGGGSSTLTISNKTAAYTVVAGDLGTIINCTSGTFTVSLTAAATLGSGFNCWIWNTSSTATHAITIDPAGAETIDGTDTFTLRRGEGMQIVCDGTNWQTGDKKTMRAYAENLSVAGNDIYRPSVSGANSVAIGWRAITSAGDSISLGTQATASGDVSTAVGGLTTASAAASTAIGLNSAYGGSQAVTGAGAMALGGSRASGSNSFAAAIANNTSSYGATASNTIAIGQLVKARASNAIAIGSQADASNSGSVAIGQYATASGIGAVAITLNSSNGAYATGRGALALGDNCTASALASMALGANSLSSIIGKYAYACGTFSGAGNSQYGKTVLRLATTNATASVLTTDGIAAAATNQVTLPNASAYTFSGIIVARQQNSGGTQSAAWKVEGLIRRDANAASTTLVASTVTAISNVPGWTLDLSANTTLGCLTVTATGAATTNIRWVANIDTVEVTY